MKLAEQIAVVTGGVSGLGRACVEHLTKRNVKVVIWDIEAASFFPNAITCDVRSEASVDEALAHTIERFGIPRICINCAGIAPAKRMVGKDGPMPLADFKRVIDINLVGTFNVMRVVAAAMSSLPLGGEERGIIINTASIAAMEGQIGQLAYSASKGGIVSMTLPAARELATFGIRVNTIAPGLMATPLLLGMPEPVQAGLAASVTFPKRLGKPEEYAALVQHIIENIYLNGEIFRLDAALRMQAR
jgi:NAD(P)-dependent dehydrogenase (short-subunit alcohol dehydrogenase family)